MATHLLVCFSKLARFRKVAVVLLVWIIGLNTLLAFVWLHPISIQKSRLLVKRVEHMNLKTSNISMVTFKTLPDYIPQSAITGRLKIENNVTLTPYTRYIVNLAQFNELNHSDFDVIDSKTSGIRDSRALFVLVIPRRIDRKPMNRLDTRSTFLSGKILQAVDDLDGLACLPRKLKPLLSKNSENLKEDNLKSVLNSTWCNYARREWSIQIRNNGFLKKIKFKSTSHYLDPKLSHISMIEMCNIVNGPFVIRKEQFVKLKGLRTQFGRITVLDFFLRSNGKLKIGKFAGCFYSNNLFHFDRGSLEGTHDFPEYSNFGLAYGVLRIIMEDRIEWTKCIANDRLCKEKPYIPPSTLPEVGQPICCSVVLGEMLKDVVTVFTKLGIKYRLLYGTLLGAMRSGAIIPYSHDIDFGVDDHYALNWSNYDTLQPYFTDRYSILGNSFMGVPRLLPLMPVHLNINTSRFFDGELDVEGNRFFSPEILESIRDLLPFSPSDWRTRGYTDFYRGWGVWWNGSSVVTVDGLNYTAMKEKEYEVELWYGKNWRKPILTNFESQNDAGAV